MTTKTERFCLNLDGASIFGINDCIEHRSRLGEISNHMREMEAFIKELYVDGCEYGDDCPRNKKLNHYICRPCQARYFIEDEDRL